MMTFNEARIEQIARKYCELKGIDPDEVTYHVLDVKLKTWERVAERIRDEWTMDAAQWAFDESSTGTNEEKT